MSRKFRWFLLGSCAFVVLMGGRETVAMLARGPAQQGPSPMLESATKLALKKRAATRSSPARMLAADGELARGDGNE